MRYKFIQRSKKVPFGSIAGISSSLSDSNELVRLYEPGVFTTDTFLGKVFLLEGFSDTECAGLTRDGEDTLVDKDWE